MHGSIDTSSALASGVPLVIRQAAFIPQGRSERRVMTCLGRRRDGGQRDIELWEAPLSKRKSQSCCGRRPDHDGTLGFDKGAREPRIHTTRSAVNRPHTICQKIWHLIGAGPRGLPLALRLAITLLLLGISCCVSAFVGGVSQWEGSLLSCEDGQISRI